MKDKFNKYCAKAMCYKEVEPPHFFDRGLYVSQRNGANLWLYNPYDDLNQMADVVEKLCFNASKHWIETSNYLYPDEVSITDYFEKMRLGKSIKQAFRDFIISTMNDSKSTMPTGDKNE